MQESVEYELESTVDMHPADIAHYLESVPLEARKIIWNEVSQELRGEVLSYLHDDVLQSLLESMPNEEISSVAEQMETGDLTEVIDLLPEDIAAEVIDCLSQSDKSQLQQSLQYDEGFAGRLLDYQAITVTSKRKVHQVLSYIKKHGLPEYTDKIFMIGPNKRFKNAIALTDILAAEPDDAMADLPAMDNLEYVDPLMSLSDMAAMFRKKHHIALPVINADGVIEGRITLDDAMTVLQNEADHQFLSQAGLDEEEDLFAPVIPSAKRRAIWLGINLVTAFLASWVIGQFEGTLEKVVALAVLMPIVASMGGIAGSQTLTLIIRGYAQKKISAQNQKILLKKEIGVALVNGFVWAICVGVAVFFWFDSYGLSLVITTAIFVNVLAAAYSGILIPAVLRKVGIDPALSGSVILTTVTDIVGFLCFLGLGALFLV